MTSAPLDKDRVERAGVAALASEAAQCVVLTALTAGVLSLINPPLSEVTWPLAFVALAPWALAVCRTQRAWLVHWSSYVFGFVFFLVNLSWLMPVTGLGFVALAAYLAIYWPMAAWAIRTAQRFGVSVAWSLPVAWVACEYLRAWVMSGFPWLFISHAYYRQPLLIQCCDLVGAYGVTFLAVLVSGVMAQAALLRGIAARRGLSWQCAAGGAAAVLLWAANAAYGWHRLGQGREFVDGPRVAVVQHDFIQRTQLPFVHSEVIFAEYMALGGLAAAEGPDLVVFPESASGSIQNLEFVNTPLQAVDEYDGTAFPRGLRMHRATSALARGNYAEVNGILAEWERFLRRYGDDSRYETVLDLPRLSASGGPPVTIVIGAMAVVFNQTGAYPKHWQYNSAFVYDPDGTQRAERYDKTHLVPFGEFVPFRQQRFLGLDLHPLYRWLNSLSPFSYGGKTEYSLSSGAALTVFEFEARGRRYRFGTPICYEGAMPYVIRDYVWAGGARRVDFLVNISNDGWFLHSRELPQHLAAYVFRAIENRTGIARSVNTGISGFVTPNGEIHDLVNLNGRTVGPGVIGYSVAAVKLDRRDSLYGRSGDWFAGTCLALSGVAWIGAVVSRWIIGIKHRLERWTRRKVRDRHAPVS